MGRAPTPSCLDQGWGSVKQDGFLEGSAVVADDHDNVALCSLACDKGTRRPGSLHHAQAPQK